MMGTLRTSRLSGTFSAILALSLAGGCDLVGETFRLTGQIAGVAPRTISDDLLQVSIPSRGAQATLGPVARNGNVTVWQTLDGITLTFRDGVLTGTRGLGDDLMSGDVTHTIRMLHGGQDGYYPHIRTYIDGESRTVFRSYQCRHQPSDRQLERGASGHDAVRRIDELCVTTDGRFTNTYWMDDGGRVIRSRQWVSPTIGHLETERAMRSSRN